MKKAFMIIFITLFILNYFFSEENINWDGQDTLIWSDFQGKVDSKSRFASVTFWVITYNYNYNYNGNHLTKVKFSIYSKFDCQSSWVKKGQKTDYLLKHEQGHFDLAEIYARIFRKKVCEYNFTKSNIKNEFKMIFDDIYKECKKIQTQYDEETKHDANKSKQSWWNDYILKELEAYKKYKKTDYEITQ